MNYEVWLHARDPKSLELVATLRVFTHPDRLAAEGALENAEALFVNGPESAYNGLPFGTLVTAHMEHPAYDFTPVEFTKGGRQSIRATATPYGTDQSIADENARFAAEREYHLGRLK